MDPLQPTPDDPLAQLASAGQSPRGGDAPKTPPSPAPASRPQPRAYYRAMVVILPIVALMLLAVGALCLAILRGWIEEAVGSPSLLSVILISSGVLAGILLLCTLWIARQLKRPNG